MDMIQHDCSFCGLTMPDDMVCLDSKKNCINKNDEAAQHSERASLHDLLTCDLAPIIPGRLQTVKEAVNAAAPAAASICTRCTNRDRVACQPPLGLEPANGLVVSRGARSCLHGFHGICGGVDHTPHCHSVHGKHAILALMLAIGIIQLQRHITKPSTRHIVRNAFLFVRRWWWCLNSIDTAIVSKSIRILTGSHVQVRRSSGSSIASSMFTRTHRFATRIACHGEFC
mmetsp:Transcript_60847/g.145016  ORF Transcript_60847/g.145016 Transcript_60847/m.145016 type:complete len:228 (-) Transcript_60847:444-1127(-)